MTPIWSKRAGIIALILISYGAGTFHPRVTRSSESGAPSNSQSSRVVRENDSFRSRSSRDGKRDRSDTGFRSAVPFAPGHAREWFLSKGRENFEDSFIGLVQMVQACTALDERSAQELVEELREIRRLYDAGDPEMRAVFDGDDLQRRGFVAALFRLSQLNPQAALHLIQESPDARISEQMIQMVFANAALRSPAEAKLLLVGLEGDSLKAALDGAMASLTAKDPAAALDLISGFNQPEFDNERRKFLERIAKQDPAKAIEFAQGFVESGNSPHIIASVVSEWMLGDKVAALSWAEAYRGPGEAHVKDVAIRETATTDPRRAAEEFLKLGADAADLANSGMVIAAKYAEVDLVGAREWVDDLPAGSAKHLATLKLVEAWLKSEPMDAAAWIDQMPQGDSKNQASLSLIQAIRHRFPQEAVERASSIPNANQRAEMQEQILKDWEARDPEAADKARLELPR